MLVFALIAVYVHRQRPKSWNPRALRTLQAKAQPVTRENEKLEEESSGIIFTVDVENATSSDITLPQTLTVMQKTRDSEALHGSFLKFDDDYFIPARHVVTITISADNLCTADFEPQGCYDQTFKGDSEIIVFDNSEKYELRIPIPALTLPAKEPVWPTVKP